MIRAAMLAGGGERALSSARPIVSMTARSTPLARIDARARKHPGVLEGADRDDHPVAGKVRAGIALGTLPGIGVVPLRGREGGDDPLELGLPHPRFDPMKHAAEGDEAHAVMAGEIGGRQASRRADLAGKHGGFEGIDEQD